MSEQISSNRLLFPAGEQIKYLEAARNKLNISWPKLAEQCETNPRMLNDWKREKYSLPETIGNKISKITGIPLPEEIIIQDRFWYTSKGGKISGPKVYERYGKVGGDATYRKQQWEKWWKESGNKNNLGSFAKQRDILIPKPSEKLAELAGIILGDGGITERQVKITLDSETDKEYLLFVSNLFTKLFGVTPNTRKRPAVRAVDIVISRTKLVKFWTDMGIPPGNKTSRQAQMPSWVKNSKNFQIAFLRGLMDTDGCIFNECHRIKGKEYCYPRISFVNKSQPLLFSVFEILSSRGFVPKIRGKRAVILEKSEDVIRYFNEVGTHNPKHAARFVSFVGKILSDTVRRSV